MGARLRKYAVNGFIGLILFCLAVDTVPQSPRAVRELISPWLLRAGIRQSVWNLFAPEPDVVNTRLRAEITYRDGELRQWQGPDWSQTSAWQKWIGYRDVRWYDYVSEQSGAAAWEPWCRYLARTERPDFPDADRGAEVRVTYRESVTPSASERPWRSMREPMPFGEEWVLTIEKFE
jgi:hypothetical protein